MKYKAIVIGSSVGGLNAIASILSGLQKNYAIPIVIAQHVHKDIDPEFLDFFKSKSLLEIKEAEDKERIMRGKVYFAPPDYHLLLEEDLTLSLSLDEKVNFSRPSIDVLFESAAYSMGSALIAILLTGANADGAHGMKKIRARGGLTIVQDPTEAEMAVMPSSALDMGIVDHILSLAEIGLYLSKLSKLKNVRDDAKNTNC